MSCSTILILLLKGQKCGPSTYEEIRISQRISSKVKKKVSISQTYVQNYSQAEMANKV